MSRIQAVDVFGSRIDLGTTAESVGGVTSTLMGGLDGFLNNPASLAYYQGSRAAGGSYQAKPGNFESWSGALIDGSNALVGGLQYQWAENRRPRRQSYTLTGAYRYNWLWIGLSTQATSISQTKPGSGWHFTGTSGVIAQAPSGLVLGLYAKNLIDREPDQIFPPTFVGGIGWTIGQKLKLSADAQRRFKISDQDWNFSSGAEILLKDYLIARSGYHWDRSKEDSYWSAGACLVSGKIELNFGFTQTTDDPRRSYSGEMLLKF